MNVLVVGSGGREHALVFKIALSRRVKKIYCAPGNAGISSLAECVDIGVDDIDGLVAFAREKQMDLTVVGPEAPLVDGIVDEFQKNGLKIFGPSRAAARLEASKGFAKDVMQRCGVPTARFKSCRDRHQVRAAIEALGVPVVIKADGLAAGKGVSICASAEEALDVAAAILEKRIFGDAGKVVIVEECLEGEEASILVLTDGDDCVPLDSSQDHKRAFDGDRGPNTGGMGAYSPAPVVTPELFKTVMERVIKPVVRSMRESGSPYKGVLYAGIMINERGPHVLEFNVRFGDPETQAVLARLESDLVDALFWTIEGGPPPVLRWNKRSSVCVVMASGGYPGLYRQGREITGLERAADDDVFVFHAGTKKAVMDFSVSAVRYTTNGGRVLGVTGLGETIQEAAEKAYRAVGEIHFEGAHYRKDIASRAILKGDQESEMSAFPTEDKKRGIK